MEKNSYQIIDNFLTPSYHKVLLGLMEGDSFPWFYKKNISLSNNLFKDDELNSSGFFHLLDNNSMYSNLFKPMLYHIMDKAKCTEILRARADMTMYSVETKTHEPHVDHPELEHTSAVYYVNDSDGDTILYGEKYDEKYVKKPEYTLKPEDFTEIQRVTPKANRLFIFNGLNIHTGQSPSKHKHRIIINSNFI